MIGTLDFFNFLLGTNAIIRREKIRIDLGINRKVFSEKKKNVHLNCCYFTNQKKKKNRSLLLLLF